MKNKGETMNLVHETVNIKGWDICGPVDWKIGDETELPFEDHQPDKTLHYIEGYDKAGTLVSCIGEVVDGTVVNVFLGYQIDTWVTRLWLKKE